MNNLGFSEITEWEPCSRLAAMLYEDGLFFLQVYFVFTSYFLMTALKGKEKAAVKIGMQYGKLITDSRFYKPPK